MGKSPTTRDRNAVVTWRIRPAVRRGLKVAAATQDTSMEAIADRVLCDYLLRHGLMSPESASMATGCNP